jgi:predicted ATPase/class 3 adenylate cyclase
VVARPVTGADEGVAVGVGDADGDPDGRALVVGAAVAGRVFELPPELLQFVRTAQKSAHAKTAGIVRLFRTDGRSSFDSSTQGTLGRIPSLSSPEGATPGLLPRRHAGRGARRERLKLLPGVNSGEPPSGSSSAPTGTVSFLFTDIEGSTVRWETHGDAMRAAVARHDALLRAAIAENRGHVFKTMGDAFCAAFHTPLDAVHAAASAQRRLAAEDWNDIDGMPVRMAVHLGAVEARDGDFFGQPLNKLARLLAVAHGGQVVLTGAAAEVVADALPSDVRLSDLGRHRLKDLELAEHVLQLIADGVPATFPPLRSLDAHANNLPVQLTSFIGREREMAELAAPLAASRLLTLVGAGGVGKTRLALQLAADALDRYADGVWLIELSPLLRAEDVAAETATVLSLRVNAKEPVTTSILRELREKQTLLIYDSCEHLIAPTATLVASLLSSCPGVTILASSRQPLQIAGERVHQIGVLDVPAAAVTTAAQALTSSAVRLFVERARDASARFALTDANAQAIGDICRRLDGIALAIELAASKVAVLSPRQLADRLNERFRLLAGGSRTALPRQQTLRALIDWSYDLLDDRERLVFRRLAAFAGSFSLEAVSAVCADDELDEWEVFELLAALVAKSLVVVEQAGEDQRYRLLDSMREYARARAEQAGDTAAVTARHGRFYAAFLTGAGDATDEPAWQRSVELEIDNIRSALSAAFAAGGERATGFRILASLGKSAVLVMTPQEVVAWFEAAVAVLDDDTAPALAAALLNNCAYAEWFVGISIQRRTATIERAIAAAKRSGVGEHVVEAYTRFGSCLSDAGRLDEADAAFREASEHAAGLTDKTRASLEMSWGINDLQREDLEAARRRFAHVAALERADSERRGAALLNLGEVEFARGDLDAALDAARRAKKLYAALNAPGLGLLACNLAAYALAADSLDEAANALREALDHLRRSGAGWLTAALEHHALLAALRDDDERAALLLGYTQERYREAGKGRQLTEQRGYDRAVHLLRERLAPDALAGYFGAGALLTEGEAIDLAIAARQGAGELPSPALREAFYGSS